MESQLKQRLIGAAVLVALAVVFLPALLKGPDVKEPDAAQVPLSMPATPSGDYETRELPLNAPEAAPANGVLGLTPAEAEAIPDANAAPPAPAASTVAVAPAPAASTPPPVAAAPVAPAPVAPAPKPEVVPPAPAVAPAALAAGKYMINIGSFSNVANADALVAKLRAKQLPVVADKVKLASGTAMRVRVGPYADRATAEAARLRAEEITGSAGKVVASEASAADLAAAPKPAAAEKPADKPVATKPEATKPDAVKPEAAKPAPAKPAAAPASAVGVGFAVQLSAPAVEADANALRDKARAQGLSAFVQPVETDSGRRYRVRVGPVADRAAAESLREEVQAKLGNKGIIVSNP